MCERAPIESRFNAFGKSADHFDCVQPWKAFFNALPFGHPTLFRTKHRNHSVEIGCGAFRHSILTSLHLEHWFAVGTSFQVEISRRLDELTSKTRSKLFLSCRHCGEVRPLNPIDHEHKTRRGILTR